MVRGHLGSARPRNRTRPDRLRRWRRRPGRRGWWRRRADHGRLGHLLPTDGVHEKRESGRLRHRPMNEIAKRANLQAEYQNVTFDGIIPGLGNNLYDAGLSSFTITKAREQKVDFSDPYFNADQSLMVQSDSPIKSVDDIADGTVGVQLGTTGELKAKEFKQEGKITGEVRTFDTITDAFAALENGQIEAVINDFPVSAYKANQSDGTLQVVQTFPTGEQYGIAFPQDSDLLEPTNKALEEIKKDGTYAELYEKWLGEKPNKIP